MISNKSKCNFLQLLERLNIKHAKIFTLKELSFHFNVSERKLIDFRNGKIFDFWLLEQYAGIIGVNIYFNVVS